MRQQTFAIAAMCAASLLASGASGACGTSATSSGNADSEAGVDSSGASSSGGSSGGGSTSSSGSGGSSGSSGSRDGGGAVDSGPAPDSSAVTDGGSGGDAESGDAGGSSRFACPSGPFPAPVAGASQSVCEGFSFNYNLQDGPTWITSEGAFFFSNYVQGASGPGDIIKYTPGGQCETWLADAGCNGLTSAYDGTLVAACQAPRAVVAFDLRTKQGTTLASMYQGQPLDSPNDIVAHSSGAIFFTNPTYELGQRPVGVGPAEFYIDPSGTLNLIAKLSGKQPNGIALSPDEKHLYVEEDSSGVVVYDLDANGTPTSSARPFAGKTDGISVDCAGNLYLSGGSIVDPTGKTIGSFPGGGTMAAFGGADGRTLLIVGAGGGTALHTVSMNVPGPPH
jgi:gluconolactonase